MFLAAACAPSRSTLTRVRVRGAFSGDLLCRSACEGGHHSLRLASRISSRKAGVAPTWDLIRGSLTLAGFRLKRLQFLESGFDRGELVKIAVAAFLRDLQLLDRALQIAQKIIGFGL